MERLRQDKPQIRLERVEPAAFRIPTDRPEADGTFRWESTTLVTVHASGGGQVGFGYTYGSGAIVPLVRELAGAIVGQDALGIEGIWNTLVSEVRNIGRTGIASGAISAIDASLWDLKAKILDLPLVTLLGQVRPRAEVYGSGGFTSYSTTELCEQLDGWSGSGISRVKMKVGRDPDADPDRVACARRAIGERVELMVDANGAYSAFEAVGKAHAFAESAVSWFEEPVSSDFLDGLRAIRSRMPPGMALAAGEYGYDPLYFRRMLAAEAVDVLQADATRCLGITGFLAAARLCQAFSTPLSAHTAPSLHLHPACAATPLVHVEYFHDHARIEEMLFEGFVAPRGGAMEPDLGRPGLGVELKHEDAARFVIGAS